MSDKKVKKQLGVIAKNEDLAQLAAPGAGFAFVVDPATTQDLAKSDATDRSPFLNTVLNELNQFELKKSESDASKPIRISFDVDARNYEYSGVYRQITNLLPDDIKKRIIGPGGDDLVCQILLARSNHTSLMARPRDNRFDNGFDFLPNDKSRLPKDPTEMATLMLEVEKVKEFIWGCGTTKVIGEQEQPSFSQYVKMITRDGLAFGRHSTEYIYDERDPTKLVAFRPVDAGTIYRTTLFSQQDDSIRISALTELEKLYSQKIVKQKIDLAKYKQGDYIYCQVINGQPRQFFTANEMIVHNMYPTTNVEFGGYPLTPIDQAIHAITTHINITQHNKLYFQYGRAARGMLVIKSKNIDEKKLQVLRAQFQQTINSVKHAHRMPVFGITPEDEVTWSPIDNSSRDQEFSFLSDSNARVILGAFQMSPDELPGYGHLSKGSNTQALSESNNEYKLVAARDVGIRPMLSDLQDFINKNIIPKINPKIAKLFSFTFLGIDKESPDKENARLESSIQIYSTMNDVLDEVEKERIPKSMGGDLIMNPLYWQTVSPYLTVGVIMEQMLGVKGASKDPRYMYVRDPMWFQYQQMIQAEVQMRIQAGMQALMPQPTPISDGSGQPESESGSEETPKEDVQKSEPNFMAANAELDALRKKWGV